MSQTSRIDQMVADAKCDIARQCAQARGESPPSVLSQPPPRPQTVAELVVTAKREIACACIQATSSLVSQSSRSAVALPCVRVEPFSPLQGLMGMFCDWDRALLVRRLFVLSVLGLFAFIVLPDRAPEAQEHLVLMTGMVLSSAFVAGLFVVMLWSLWRND